MLLCTGFGFLSGYLAGSPNTCRWQSQLSGGRGSAGARAGRAAAAYFSDMVLPVVGTHVFVAGNRRERKPRRALASGGGMWISRVAVDGRETHMTIFSHSHRSIVRSLMLSLVLLVTGVASAYATDTKPKFGPQAISIQTSHGYLR